MTEHSHTDDRSVTVNVIKVGVRIPVAMEFLDQSPDAAQAHLQYKAQQEFSKYGRLVGEITTKIVRYEEMTPDEQAGLPVNTCFALYTGYCIRHEEQEK